MASVLLEYDHTRQVTDDPDIGVELIVDDLPDTCIRCGACATETVDLVFTDDKTGRMATIVAPVCGNHPLFGLMTIAVVLCICLIMPCVGVFGLLLWLAPALNNVWIPVFFPLIILLICLGLGARFGLVFFDIESANIDSHAVEIKGVAPEFVTAYRKYRKAKKRQENDRLFGAAGRDRPKKRLRKKKKKPFRKIEDLVKRPIFYICAGVVLFVGLGCFGGIGMLIFLSDRRGAQNLPAPPRPIAPGQKAKPFQPVRPALAFVPKSPLDIDGLTAYWPFDEGAGGKSVDKSPNKMGGTLVGATWIQGFRGSALWFDGAEAYFDLGNSPALNFGDKAAFTVAGWAATKTSDGPVFAFRNADNEASVVHLQVDRGRFQAIVRSDGSIFGEAKVKSGAINDGKWRHFAVVRQPDAQMELYLDGKPQGKAGGRPGPITTNLRALGSERYWVKTNWRGPWQPYYAGAIDEFCVFNRALSAGEILLLAGRKIHQFQDF